MNAMMKKIITEKVEWLREHGVLCYVGNLDDATPTEIDKLCDAIEDMTAQVLEAEGEGKPWEADDDCDYNDDCDDDDCDYDDDCDDDDCDFNKALLSSAASEVHKAISELITAMISTLDSLFDEECSTKIIKAVLRDIVDEM